MRRFAIILVTAGIAAGGFARSAGADEAEIVRRWAAAVREIKGPDGASAVEQFELVTVSVARGVRSPEAKAAIVRDLGSLAVVIQDKTRDATVRSSVLHTVGTLGDWGLEHPLCVQALSRVLVDEEDVPEVRGMAAMVAPAFAKRPSVAPALLLASKSRNGDVRVNALQALPRVQSDPEILIERVAEAISDPIPAARIAAVTAAASMVNKDRRFAPVLVRGLHDDDAMVRQISLVMTKRSPEAYRGEVQGMMTDKNPDVRLQAAAMLLRDDRDGAEARRLLEESLSSSDAKTRASAALALASWGARGVPPIPSLTAAVHDPDERVRLFAAVATTKLTGDGDDSLPVVLKALGSKDDEVYQWAAHFLLPTAMRARKSALPVLSGAAKDEPPRARAVVVASLSALDSKGDKALPVLREALKDPDPNVRSAALLALAGMGPRAREALDEIRARLKDDNDEVRSMAADAIREIDK